MRQLKLFEDVNTSENRQENEVFDWAKEFPKCCDENGNFEGFDVVIGNPPYSGVRTSQIPKEQSVFFKKNYQTAKGQYDIFALFIELAYRILNKNGFHAYIVSKRMATNENFENLRVFLMKKLGLFQFADAQMPFHAAGVEANIIFTQKDKQFDTIKNYSVEHRTINSINTIETETINQLPFKIFPFFIEKESLTVLQKINQVKNNLSDCVQIIRGFEFGFNHQSINKKSKGYKVVKGENIKKYVVQETGFYVDADFSDSKTFKKEAYFLTNPKLLTRFVSNKLMFALDNVGYCNTNVVYNIIKKPACTLDLKYLLALLNSRLLNFWFYNTYSNTDKLFPHIQKNQLSAIPIAETSKTNQTPIIKLVDKILKQKEKAPESDTTKLEKQIDKAVYKLYGLTKEEIKVVENGCN